MTIAEERGLLGRAGESKDRKAHRNTCVSDGPQPASGNQYKNAVRSGIKVTGDAPASPSNQCNPLELGCGAGCSDKESNPMLVVGRSSSWHSMKFHHRQTARFGRPHDLFCEQWLYNRSPSTIRQHEGLHKESLLKIWLATLFF